MAVATHVLELLQLGQGGLSPAIAFLAIIGVWVEVIVALFCREFHNGFGEGLDLHRHCIELGVLCLGVGCMVVVGHHHTHNMGDVVADFVAMVRKLVCQLVLVLASSAAPCILLVCVGCFHQHFELLLGVSPRRQICQHRPMS